MKFSNTINPGDLIAIGDIHARYDLFSEMVEWLTGSGARVIILGDLIDRGGSDMQVLNLASDLLHDPESFGLESFSIIRGNHEQMFVDAAHDHYGDMVALWVLNGGNIHQFSEMADTHLHWIEKLPFFIRVADTIFVHAGLKPGENPEETVKTNPDHLIWIREPFLSQGPKLRKWTNSVNMVVHGHTPLKDKPIVKKDRVNIDTGAFFSGFLTAFNVTQNTFHQIDGSMDLDFLNL